MDRAGSRGRNAHADLAGELGVPARHERGHLLVAGLNESQSSEMAPEGAHNPVDPIPGKPVDALHPHCLRRSSMNAPTDCDMEVSWL